MSLGNFIDSVMTFGEITIINNSQWPILYSGLPFSMEHDQEGNTTGSVKLWG